jgi:nucleotide-binding universal stress UspA family protein
MTGPQIAAEPPTDQYRLVVATDGMESGGALIEELSTLFGGTGVSCTLLGIFEMVVGEGSEQAQRTRLAERLELLRSGLRVAGEVDVVVGEAKGLAQLPAAILREADAQGASAIALSTTRQGRLKQLLEGSTALAVLRKSPVPVVLVRPRPG